MSDKDLKCLQKDWYKILKDEGFSDIEYFDKNGEPYDLLRSGGKFTQLHDATQEASASAQANFDDVTNYYHQASAFLHSAKGQALPQDHKLVWELHTEGQTVRAIAKVVGFSFVKVHKLIHKIKAIMEPPIL